MTATDVFREPPAAELSANRVRFIEAQPFFLVATAAAEGRVNVSPKGLDTLRVLGPDRIVWLNLTGSGNETAAHVLASGGRMTLMFMSTDATTMILRVYGSARVVHERDEDWAELIALFPELAGSRQIFDLHIESVVDSCGSGVPIMALEADRGETELVPFYAAMETEVIHTYWRKKNTTSLDGHPTGLFADDA